MDVEIDESPWRIIAHFFDDLRLVFNRSLDHLEPWQVGRPFFPSLHSECSFEVIMYTLSATLFVQWLRKVMKIDDAMTISRSWHNLLMSTTAFYRDKIEEQKQETQKEIEEKLLRADIKREFYKFLPEKGLGRRGHRERSDRVQTDGRPAFRTGTRERRLIFELYSHTNANFVDIYPACRKMESEIIRMLCSLYHGGPRSCGTVTTSGTESIILACIAYRNLAVKRGIRKPEVIIGRNADVTLNIATKLLGLRMVSIPTDSNGQMDLAAIKRSISLETCMIVASAPSFITGVMDDVEKISELGLRYNVPVHVDASIGGFLLPFMEQCDYQAPMFDFRLSGVTSISYAYCPIGSSAVLYREQHMLHAQTFADVNWAGGIFVSPTLSGSRPGSLLALTWATLLGTGRLGYVERTQRILDATHALREKLEDSQHVEVIGNPVLSSVAFRTKNPKVHCYMLGDLLNELGWNPRVRHKAASVRFYLSILRMVRVASSLRICLSVKNAAPEVITEFVDDLNRSCERIEKNADTATIPKMVVFFGVSSSFVDRGIVEDMPSLFIDTYYSTPLRQNRTARTLSIEGRKLSQLHNPPSSGFLSALQEQSRQESSGSRFSSNLTPHLE
ncbi:Sphingosine-1-phosphate lyase 1 [Aphelenchoides fujianensis]|nr:Sphingosine-1-phosphate lyase 1 [Aphelenchoides fujianensis]